jgi:hypothetical protein
VVLAANPSTGLATTFCFKKINKFTCMSVSSFICTPKLLLLRYNLGLLYGDIAQNLRCYLKSVLISSGWIPTQKKQLFHVLNIYRNVITSSVGKADNPTAPVLAESTTGNT